MDSFGEILIYQTEDGLTKINVNMQNETVWLTLDQMAELFQRDKSTISRHINNVFKEGELKREATVANFATVQLEGDRTVKRNIEYCWIYMRQALITILKVKSRYSFLRLYRINCIMPHTVILRLKLFMKEQTQKNLLWD